MSEPDEPEDEKPDPLDPYADEEIGPLPINVAGAVNTEVNTKRISLPTADTFVCLRGPCRYYWEMVTPGEFMELPGVEPIPSINRFCTYASDATELTDRTVLECNRWFPMDADDHNDLLEARTAYANRTGGK